MSRLYQQTFSIQTEKSGTGVELDTAVFINNLESYIMNQIHIIKAQFLKRTLGPRVAAGYLRNRNWSLESALWIVCRTQCRI